MAGHQNITLPTKNHLKNQSPYDKKMQKLPEKNISKDEKSTHNPDNTIADSLQ
jgi:hypothetical protein